MKLGEEILAQFGGEDPSRIICTVTAGRGGYFRNVKRIVEFSSVRIVLRGKRGTVTVTGEGLALGKYTAEDVAVRGMISAVSCGE